MIKKMIKKYSEFLKIMESLEIPYKYNNIQLEIIDLLTSNDESKRILGLQQEKSQNIDLRLFWQDVFNLNKVLYKETDNKIQSLKIFNNFWKVFKTFKGFSLSNWDLLKKVGVIISLEIKDDSYSDYLSKVLPFSILENLIINSYFDMGNYDSKFFEKITHIDCGNLGELKNIQYAKNLITLKCDGKPPKDLEKLINLENLFLNHKDLKDISFVKNMLKLKQLAFRSKKIENGIELLDNLKNLEYLTIPSMYANDLTSFKEINPNCKIKFIND